METVPCLLCGSTDAHPILRRAAPRHVICRKCGFVYQSPRPTAAEMAQHYNGQYWATHTHEDAGAAERANHIATWAARRLGPGALVCEIGCGPGHVLAHVQGLTGCRAVGVEPDPHMAESARARGLNVICGTLESVEIGGIDVLILSHVLEHFNDPLSALRRATVDSPAWAANHWSVAAEK